MLAGKTVAGRRNRLSPILMIIILKKIPAHTGNKEIEGFIKPAIKGGLFKKGGSIEKISTFSKEFPDSQATEYFALVTIEPDEFGAEAIRKLNYKRINGKNIRVAEYKVRSDANDPRLRSNPSKELFDKRKVDRRRKPKPEAKFASHPEHARKLI
jgi:hypothetical protein